EPIVEAFEKDPALGAAQPKILGMELRDHLEYAGACGGFLDWLGYPFLRGRLFFTTEKDEGQYDQPIGLFWASGACIFLRKQTLEEVGYIDEDFIMHQEEIDLCWRIRLMGWDIKSIPASRVWHHVGGTLDQDSPRKTYWNFRNNIFLLIKNLSPGNLLLRLPLRIPLDMVAMGLELLKGHFRNAAAVAKAYGWLITHIPLMLRKRRITQQMRRVSDREVLNRMYPGSIVFEYFILKRKKFSQLLYLSRWLERIAETPGEGSPFKKKSVETVV
ncbi:MAG: glycosyltransferase family 2 protein, partial [Calditrichaeota bacterium]